ncbi:uncharacterized protein [Lepisosteus oculatus]|uniref:uncharacterized protein isoform X3 n=1 Tax=Lepisosteus oculatus TaxID=7918 RepID=UPI003712CEA1
MSAALEDSDCNSSFGGLAPSSPDPMNKACLFDDSMELFDSLDVSRGSEPPSFLSKTPSPVFSKANTRCFRAASREEEIESALHENCSAVKDRGEGLSTTPSHQKQKRRKQTVFNGSLGSHQWDTKDPSCKRGSRSKGARHNGFISALSLMAAEPSAPVPLRKGVVCSSSDCAPSTSGGADAGSCSPSQLLGKESQVQPVFPGHTSQVGSLVRSHQRKRQRSGSVGSKLKTGSHSPAELPPSVSSNNQEPELLEPVWGDLSLDRRIYHQGGELLLVGNEEPVEIVISDDEDDAFFEAVVRSAQMEEDEMLARHLQAQFDREEQLDQDSLSRRSTQRSHPSAQNGRLDYNLHFHPMLTANHFVATFPQLSGLGENRASRQRHGRPRQTQNAVQNLFDDSQGNNYEAILAFEDHQGAVVSKPKLSKREIERLPTKPFNPAYSAGKTECQICFSDYREGEQLRVLPCLHDYHAKCIDRWLKVFWSIVLMIGKNAGMLEKPHSTALSKGACKTAIRSLHSSIRKY